MARLNKLTSILGIGTSFILTTLAPIAISTTNNQTALVIGDGSAQAQMSYKPPADRKRMQRTQGSGARGCTNSIPVKLSLLTPGDHTARTTSARPTFLWNVSDATTAPIEFTLTAPGSSRVIHTQQLKANKPGIMKMELPTTAPELEVGKEYRWTVAIVCNSQRPSQNINARAWIERVGITPELQNKLTAAKSERDRAIAFTQEGIFNDGLAILNNLKSANSRGANAKEANELFTSLLQQVGIEKASREGESRIRS